MAGEMTALVGRNIRLAREQQGRFNQRELAEELRKREPTRAAVNQRVSDWERGVQKPNEHYMRLLSEILKRPVSWFYEDHERGETPDPLPAPVPDTAKLLERLEAIEEELRLLRVGQLARVMAILQRLDEALPPKPESQQKRPA